MYQARAEQRCLNTLQWHLAVFFVLLAFCRAASAYETLTFSTAADAPIQEISEQVLREAYQNIGFMIHVERLPNPRSMLTSNSGQLDGELSRVAGIEVEFENLVAVPVPVNINEAYAFSKRKDIKTSDWESLRPYRLACVLGVQVIKLSLLERGIPCDYVATHQQTLKMLQLERVDIALMPRVNALSALKSANITDIEIAGGPLITLNLYHYLHKKNAKIIPHISAALKKMEASGRIREIRQNYLEVNQLK